MKIWNAKQSNLKKGSSCAERKEPVEKPKEQRMGDEEQEVKL